MLTKEQWQEAAERLYHAEKQREQISALTLQYPEMTMDDAYQIQSEWVGRKVSEGAQVKGYKIGLTSRAMQMAVNIDQPDYGVLLDDMFFPDGAQIKADDFLDPRIEVELAFVLKDKLEGDDVTIFDVLNATDYVVPALELIAARCHRTDPNTGYTRKVYDTIADNAANAGIILGGRPIKPTEFDLRWAGAMLYLNGQIEETGLAAGVLGHPANGICWVCKRFAPHGVSLEPGQVILAGSFTRPVAVKAGDTIHADFGPLGGISVKFV
ncbi:2-oxo-hepta-3-ene-1,7-dioic acid hydratase [Vibrio vulnificus]|uniref:2-oxo-hepta-3-ene-1,7-dioic acid hydratase n=1 Tax=Vibrio vulnificus TaxID=672 RepID=A0A087I2F1_VIBVL|nr:2-oxo-hepta-3-ene-1,7-dioic acid hydratase [Vibrio vulnificus]AUL95493.1 2-keto-4-pentenoate hydratase [Vibrio vulnificus]EGQ7934315.1 2-oxo-hepta-3-ene-1,7-dioic acid hydratase [Vibrio vulnificus]EGQ9933887.1 2-oxo-hepta-3-ene-1,7-dioic acid hydratase [Vibrio vulnificus]EGR0061428.1 2-oxo-hepta-3-ene-1,7-dioic acid hydratase [Vibrio vulnificus]EGR0207946.1 2-oxo-hepta-3-ene-1,7-dioic acid hydratase [Vibrio vulnificus]